MHASQPTTPASSAPAILWTSPQFRLLDTGPYYTRQLLLQERTVHGGWRSLAEFASRTEAWTWLVAYRR